MTSARIAELTSALSFDAASITYASGGSLKWNYALADSSLDFLGTSEVVTITLPITVTDPAGQATTQNIIVTLRGTNDAPTMTAYTAADTSAALSEATATLASAATYSAQGVLVLSDLDLTDTHAISIAPKAGGYLGAFSAVVVDTALGAPGSITWTYNAQDKMLDGLAEGQVAYQVYTITLNDKKGGKTTQDVTIRLTGTNDVPVVSGSVAGYVAEGAATNYNLTGTLSIADADLTDRPVVSILSQDVSFKNLAGDDVTSSLTQSVIDQLKGAFSMSVGTLVTNKGAATWVYSIADSAIDFMGRSEMATLKTTIQISDQHGGTVTKDVIITVRGTNDNVVFNNAASGSPSLSATVVESEGKSNSDTLDSASGTMLFVDKDSSDIHAVTVAAQGKNYVGKFVATLSETDATATGAVNWTYAVADKALDYLAQGEELTQTYRISVSDGKGSMVSQDVSVHHIGVDDAAVVSGATHATYYQSLGSFLDKPITFDGLVKITDPDASDTVVVQTSAVHVTIYDVNGIDLSSLPPSQLTAAQALMLEKAGTLGEYLSVSAGSAVNAGQVTWSYDVTPDKVSFLGAGYYAEVKVDATISSTHAQTGQVSVVTQPIVVDLVGSDTSFQAKDYLSHVLDNTILQSLPANVTLGNQVAVSDLQDYRTLTAADGVIVRSAITLEVTKNGAIFDGVDFRNVQVSVLADNVKFVNCIFNATTDIFVSLRAAAGTTGLIVDHSTFDGGKINSAFQDFILAQGVDATITNNMFIDAPIDAVAIMGGTVSGNYFHGGGYYSLAHSDAIWVGKTNSPVVISNNIIDWRSPVDAATGTNNAIRISSELGSIDKVLVQNNVLVGGNYTITVTNGPTWTNTAEQMGSLTNVVIKNNAIGLGVTGEFDTQFLPAGTIYTGNYGPTGTGTSFGSSETAGKLSFVGYDATIGTVANDSFWGGHADHYLVGGAGSDIITGGSGNDIIQGGGGRDFLYGGAGADIFLLTSLSDGADSIRDFEQGIDKIDISGLVAQSAASDWSWVGTDRFTGTPLQIRYAVNASGVTSFFIDLNGDTAFDYRIDLTGVYNLSMSDLIIHRDGTAVVEPYSFSDSNLDLMASKANFSFTFASAPIVFIKGQAALAHADGSLLPISGLSTYAFADGTINVADGNVMVDDLFYYATHKSVWNAGLDAEAHYAATGWQLGYDPNFYFSTNGYAAAHTAAAGMNPLDYYHTTGWKLGDDPSVNFDTELYLLMNPDVAKSGLDPLEHYLSIGHGQGRTVYAAIGDQIVNGFDEEYYLLANPSVAKSGMTALQHYQTVGWQQGLRPNAYFDPSYYLASNPDVAASGVEPLAHFMAVGWMQGRDPSALFDVSSYLAASPDVAASGMNPLTHFLTIGAYEGRVSFEAGVSLVGSAPTAAADAAIAQSVVGTILMSPTSVLTNDSDADRNVLKVVSVNGSVGNIGAEVVGSYGTLKMGADGTFSYAVTSTMGATGGHLVDHFRYVVADGKGGFNSANLDITLNRAAVLSNDATITKNLAGRQLSVSATNGVLANDTDADGDPLHVISVAGSQDGVGRAIHGTYGDLLLNADGSYSYVQNGIAPAATSVTDTFTYGVSDGFGGVSSAQLVINIIPANTAPVLSGDVSGTLVQGAASLYSLTGKLTFSDSDLDDSLTVSLAGRTVSFSSASGQDISASLTPDQISKFLSSFSVPLGQIGTNGSLDWRYQLADTATAFLAAGEVLTVVTRVQVTDLSNAVSYQDVSIKITGTNDKPIFDVVSAQDPNVYVVLSEPALETGSLNVQTRASTLFFSDLDINDVHSVSVVMKGAGYLGSMSTQLQEPVNGTGGAVVATYSIPDKRFDALSAGQVITQTYVITVTDSKGAVTKQNVNVVLNGADDLPTITGSAKLSWVEGQAVSYVKSGVLNLSDVDTNDHLMISFDRPTLSVKASDGADITSYLSDSQAILLKNAFSMPVGDLGKNSGKATWDYVINDSALDFLGANDFVTINTTVHADDGSGEVTQVISLSVRGINDAPTVKSYSPGDVAISGGVVETSNVSGKTFLDTTSGSFNFADADLSDKHTVTVKAAVGGYLGNLTASLGSDTTGGNTGVVNWAFSVADNMLDVLGAGQKLQQTYTVSISDGKGVLVKQDIAITLNGAADQYLFTNQTTQIISNFVPGSDTLAFNSSNFGRYAAGTLDASHFSYGTAAIGDNSAQFVYDGSNGKLLYDADGIGSGAAVMVTQLNGNPTLHFSDLLIV
ncbi:hypothetical protein ASG25_02940 [Rhizobium sp. Leaf384]|nr:hypothetical protein ASG25_02940 [Rhizobium sp. Leaf384]KQS86606.1 hypothetical protein ASG58_18015 [Rhizobium sp. Leaf383]